jgi:uncharacterized protein (TIGR02246 family)
MQVETLYRRLIGCWNDNDAEGFASCFTDEGTTIGFDGTTMCGPAAIAEHLGAIFRDHQTGVYVPLIRAVQDIARGVATLRAEVGMVPPGEDDVNPATNAVHTMTAVDGADGWRIALFQNTPAAFHGRPADGERLTEELRDAWRGAERA